MHGIVVFQLCVNNLLKVELGISSVHENCFMTIINFYKNTINYCSKKCYCDFKERNLHETIIFEKNELLKSMYICRKQEFSCMIEKINYNRIKAVLAEKNVSSKTLAKHLNKTESTVSRWCTNDVQPSVEIFSQIAEYLEIDIRELFVSTTKNR